MLTALERGHKHEMNMILKNFKHANGGANYAALLRVPFGDRIPGLILKEGLKKVHMLMAAAIQTAMENMNLSRTLSAEQIFDLVDILIDTATEDYIAIEDLILFLQSLVRGNAGNTYNKMDVPMFMQMFEQHRQARHEAYTGIKFEQDIQFKTLPINDRFIEDIGDEEKEKTRTAITNFMKRKPE